MTMAAKQSDWRTAGHVPPAGDNGAPFELEGPLGNCPPSQSLSNFMEAIKSQGDGPARLWALDNALARHRADKRLTPAQYRVLHEIVETCKKRWRYCTLSNSVVGFRVGGMDRSNARARINELALMGVLQLHTVPIGQLGNRMVAVTIVCSADDRAGLSIKKLRELEAMRFQGSDAIIDAEEDGHLRYADTYAEGEVLSTKGEVLRTQGEVATTAPRNNREVPTTSREVPTTSREVPRTSHTEIEIDQTASDGVYNSVPKGEAKVNQEGTPSVLESGGRAPVASVAQSKPRPDHVEIGRVLGALFWDMRKIDIDKNPNYVNRSCVDMWLNQGADLHDDIVPAIREVLGKSHLRPSSMSYFNPVIAQWLAKKASFASTVATASASAPRDSSRGGSKSQPVKGVTSAAERDETDPRKFTSNRWNVELRTAYCGGGRGWDNAYGPPPFAANSLVPRALAEQFATMHAIEPNRMT